MKAKLLSATALTLALAVPAFAQDTKATTGGPTAPAAKVEAPKVAQPAAPAATTTQKPVEAPKTAQPAAPAASTAQKPAEAPKATAAPQGAAPAAAPVKADEKK